MSSVTTVVDLLEDRDPAVEKSELEAAGMNPLC